MKFFFRENYIVQGSNIKISPKSSGEILTKYSMDPLDSALAWTKVVHVKIPRLKNVIWYPVGSTQQCGYSHHSALTSGLTSHTYRCIFCGCFLHSSCLSWVSSNNRMVQRSINNALFVSLQLWVRTSFRYFLDPEPGIVIINFSLWWQCLGILPGTHWDINHINISS